MLCICILGRFAPSVFTPRAHILGCFAPLAAFKFCLLYINLWLPSNFACHTAAFGCLQALLAIKQRLLSSFACYTAAFGCLQALLAIQQPLTAFKLHLLNSSLLLPSSFACYTAAFCCLQVLLDIAAVGCLQALLALHVIRLC